MANEDRAQHMRPHGENIEYDKLQTRYEALQHQWHDREEFLLIERDRYKAWLFDAWSNARGQTRGMQRMARRIKRLKSELAVKTIAAEGWQEASDAAWAHAGQLEALILAHNEGCRASCGRNNAHNASLKGCESYISRGMQCPDCSRDWLIEFPQSSGDCDAK